jgi:hypothetical protein
LSRAPTWVETDPAPPSECRHLRQWLPMRAGESLLLPCADPACAAGHPGDVLTIPRVWEADRGPRSWTTTLPPRPSLTVLARAEVPDGTDGMPRRHRWAWAG